MAEKDRKRGVMLVNRAPVLTLWTAVVGEVLGGQRTAAEDAQRGNGDRYLLHRAVPAKHTDERLRALSGESAIRPESVQKYLEGKFGDALEDVSNAMLELAKSLPSSQLAEKTYAPYEKFRPEIHPGKKGCGASGKLDLDLIRKMASA
jgi:hypothetical protein